MEYTEYTLEKIYENIIKEQDIENTYLEFAKKLEQAVYYQEKAGCLEKLWHINNNNNLILEVANILANKLNNFKAAQQAYNHYFYANHPKVFNEYKKNAEKLGANDFVAIEIEDFSNEIVKIADKYNMLVYVFKYAHKLKNYSFIEKEHKYLYELEIEAKKVFKQYDKTSETYMKEIEDAKNHLAMILATTKNNLEMNLIAIDLKNYNEDAFINVIDWFLSNNQNDDAINFYNKYASLYNINQAVNTIDVCDFLMKKYNDKRDYYKILKFQKMSLEFELGV